MSSIALLAVIVHGTSLPLHQLKKKEKRKKKKMK
jgi:hypothetical protein